MYTQVVFCEVISLQLHHTAEGYNGVFFLSTKLASTEQIDKAKEIIKKLTFNFQSEAFENPSEYIQIRNVHALCMRSSLKCMESHPILYRVVFR